MTHILIPDQRAFEPAPALPARVVVPASAPDKPLPASAAGTRTGWAMRGVYLASDAAAFVLSLAFASIAVNAVTASAAAAIAPVDVKLFALWLIGLLAVAYAQQTYAAIPPRPVRKFRGWVLGAMTVCAAIVGGAWLLGDGSLFSYITLAIASALAVLLASFCRAICRVVFGSAPWWGTRLIVVGSGELAAQAYKDLAREPQWGLRPIGFVDDTGMPGEAEDSPHYLGNAERLDERATEFNVDWALAAVQAFDAEELSDLMSRSGGRIRHWIILPPLARFPSLWLEACEAARRPALRVTNRLRQPWSQALKRTFDAILVLLLGLATLPLVGVIALLVRLSSPGSIFYGQERIGRFGRRFTAWKFRTMLPDADAVLARYLDEHSELAAEWRAKHKLRCDPRVTWIGRILRSTSLDELPQIWNVLLGEMSFVGPRPIVAAEIDKYAEYYEHYVQVLPGITGLWQVSGRNNTTYEERIALDVYYVQNWSLWLDIYILASTAKVVLLCEGAY
jgi:Undecaprenyl-phosphate galactose phosphotransferase WbaP